MSNKIKFFCFLGLFASLAAFPQAQIEIIVGDGPNFGLNDPTPATPIAGNEGTTLGEQRLNVIFRAADIWAQNLDSDVVIQIRATSAFQNCTPTGGVLASAGANQINRDFPNAIFPNTWYHAALANAIAGQDLSAGHDINTQYNLNLDDDPNCLGGNGWYYGFDHNQGNQVDLLAVMLHEFGHGLGFANFANEGAGTLFQGTPDIYTTFTRDLETGLDWNDMTNAERIASAVNDPDVVWTGPNVTAALPDFLTPLAELQITNPGPIAGFYDLQPASFGPTLDMELSGDIVLAVDDGADNPNNGCTALTNGADVAGKIALIDRGECNFTTKVANAQAVGAIAVIVTNNTPDGLPPMGGADASITIPSFGLSQADGQLIKDNLGGVVSGTFALSMTDFVGTNNGLLRLNAPNPVQPGSSISHWSPAATPSLLMEPSITPDLTDDVDLTLQHFEDIGWTLVEGGCTPTMITSQPTAVEACAGEEVILSVDASGDALTFQWRIDGVAIPGATGQTLTLDPISANDEGSYDVVITNDCDEITTSNAVEVTVENPIYSTEQASFWFTAASGCVDFDGDGVVTILDLIGLVNNTPIR